MTSIEDLPPAINEQPGQFARGRFCQTDFVGSSVHGGEVPDRSALLITHDTPLAGYRPYPSTPMNSYKLNFTFAHPTK